jgi:hypothetical protein
MDAHGNITVTNLNPQRYPLAIPDNALYGFAGRLACSLDAPNAYAYLAVLTVFAGQGVYVANGAEIRPTLFALLMGPPEIGKSRTYERLLRVAPWIDGEYIKTTTPASDRGLIKIYERGKDDPRAAEPTPSTLVLDEALSMMQKMLISGSTLAQTINEAFYRDRLGAADKQGPSCCTVRLSLLGNLTVHNPEEFSEAFGATTRTGLYSRFVLAPGPEAWSWSDTWTPPAVPWPPPRQIQAAAQAPLGRTINAPQVSSPSIPATAWNRLAQWREQNKGSRGRLGEIAMRVAVISAAINNDTEVGDDCLSAALTFAEWQEAVRAVYLPGYALTPDAIVTGLITDAFKAWDDKHPGTYVPFSDLQRPRNWNRKYGASLVNRVKKALVDDGILEMEGTYNEQKQEFDYKRWAKLRIAQTKAEAIS